MRGLWYIINNISEVNPRVDLAFKKIFRVEENTDLLISLVNVIVGKEDQIVEVTLLNPYNTKNFKADKLSVLDILFGGINPSIFQMKKL